MKTTLITTFAFAVMVFVFGTNPAYAYSGEPKGCQKARTPSGQIITECWLVDNPRDPEQADDGREVADSGNEGSTSAASASDQ